jgi:hypothetical protein
MKSTVFWDAMPCNLTGICRRLGGTSVNFYQHTRRHIPEYSTLHSHRSAKIIPNNEHRASVIQKP